MRLVRSLRPPTPRRVIRHTAVTPPGRASVNLVSAPDADSAARSLLCPRSLAAPLTIIPEVAGGPRRGASPFVARAVIHAVKTPATVLAVPDQRRPVVARWRRLAAACGTQFTILGSRGWVRVTLDDPAFRLTSVDAPFELIAPGEALGILRAERTREPFDFWPPVVHPHSALRATIGAKRDRLIAELASLRQFAWIIDLTAGGGVSMSNATATLAVTDDIIAAEVCLLAAQQLSWIRSGFEESVPWEHPRIQAACQLGLGISGGHALVLRVRRDDDVAQRVAERIARRLDCAVALDA